jgi:hypothetical protein
MATRPKFAEMANYSCECVECESQFGEWRANVSSPAKMAEMAILASTPIRQTGEFLASTRIRQIRRRVAIALS